jgi:ABC-type spermidine/putrescine transport system permease subunit I
MVSSVYAVIASIVCVVLAYPIATVIVGSRVGSIFAAITLAPLFVNLLLRIYALRYLSIGDGFVQYWFSFFGWHGPLFGSKTLLIMGLVYLYLPYAVIPMAVSLAGIDPASVEAGLSLGLRGRKLRRAVAGKAIRRGVLAAGILTFVPAFGDYLAPAVLGGAKDQLVATFLYERAVRGNDIAAAALGVLILWLGTVAVMLVSWKLEDN